MSKKSSTSKAPKKPDIKDEFGNPNAMPGWPGYRNRPGRSGLDPVDGRTEAAHTTGTILHQLFNGQTRNPVSLFLLGLFGLLLISPLALAVSDLIKGNSSASDGWVFLIFIAFVGIAILINLIKNLIRIRK